MIDLINTTGGWLRGLSLAALLAVTLAACGGEEATPTQAPAPAATESPSQEEVDEAATETSIEDAGASPEVEDDPAAVDAPQDINTLSVTVSDGALDPGTLQVMTGEEYSLTVTNDATAREFAITEVVDATALAADAEATIDFTAPEEPGEFDITLDGETAGTLEVQDAAGSD